MTASPGRIVLYTLSTLDADDINRRLADAHLHRAEHRSTANGVIVQVGNTAREGDIVPVVVVRAWGGTPDLINGQALLDGNATLWLTSRPEGTGPGTWAWPPRVIQSGGAA